jgi:hypothetical protein
MLVNLNIFAHVIGYFRVRLGDTSLPGRIRAPAPGSRAVAAARWQAGLHGLRVTMDGGTARIEAGIAAFCWQAVLFCVTDLRLHNR